MMIKYDSFLPFRGSVVLLPAIMKFNVGSSGYMAHLLSRVEIESSPRA